MDFKTYATVCSGVEGCSLALDGMGWQPVFFSEIEPFPCAVLKAHYPNVPNLGDMSKISFDQTKGVITNGKRSIQFHGRLDLLAGGTPCFVAGTMILTPSGYRPIEEIQLGDEVVSGSGIVRKVTAVGVKMSKVGKISIVGRPAITCTPNHPFMCVDTKRDHSRTSQTYGKKICVGDYKETRADEAVGKSVGRICLFNTDANVPKVDFPKVYNASIYQIVELAGWYLGDGYIRRFKGSNKKSVILALVNEQKIALFKETFGDVINFSIGADGKVTICCTELADWLSDNFGEGAANKRIPYWCYASDYSMFINKGYALTDGWKSGSATSYSTISKALAYGIADLQCTASVFINPTKPTSVIEGRTVHQHQSYTVRVNKNAQARFHQDRYASTVRSWTPTDGYVRVYNLTVDTDHTYIAEGIYVHNCQDFSVAGKRAGGAEGSGTRSSLMWQWLRLASEFRPRTLLWENVVGCLSTNDGRDFSKFVAAVSELGYCVAWRVLDCQYTRVDKWPMAIPQRRRRVWLVGCADAEPSDLAEILFESRSLIGDSAPRRRTREEVARAAQGGNPLNVRVVEGFFDNVRTGFPTTGEDVNHTVCSKNFYQGVVESIALEGNGQRPSHRGSGINADGAQFTLNCIEQHGVAYASQTVYNNEGMGGETEVTNTLDCSLAKVCSTQQPIIADAVPFVKVSHASGKDGEGERWEQCEVAGTRNVFDNGEMRSQEAVIYRIDPLSSNSMKSANPHSGIHEVAVAQTLDTTTPTPVKNQGGDVIVSNSNGGDVMPTISANESKLGGDNQHIDGGGGTLSMNFEMYDVGKGVSVSLNAERARDTMVVTDECVDVTD